jgi:hypothetical protein
MPVRLKIFTDSSAARGILARQGVGKIRHLEVKTLWAQDLVRDKTLAILPVATQLNPADYGTKVHTGKRTAELRALLGIRSRREVERALQRVEVTDGFNENRGQVATINTLGGGTSGNLTQLLLAAVLSLVTKTGSAYETDADDMWSDVSSTTVEVPKLTMDLSGRNKTFLIFFMLISLLSIGFAFVHLYKWSRRACARRRTWDHLWKQNQAQLGSTIIRRRNLQQPRSQG